MARNGGSSAGMSGSDGPTLSSSMRAGRRLNKSMVDYTMNMGRDAIDVNVLKNCPTTESEDGQPIGQRITPFFDDVPQMLEDIDETMYQARLYHDAVVHSDAEAAQHPAEVWNTVARPSPVYISDRMDVEKEFLSSKPRTTKVNKYVAAPSQQHGFSPMLSPSMPSHQPPRFTLRKPGSARGSKVVQQPLSGNTVRPRSVQSWQKGDDAPGAGPRFGSRGSADHVQDEFGLALHALESKQHAHNRYMGNHVSIDGRAPSPPRRPQRPASAALGRHERARVAPRPATAAPASRAGGASPGMSPRGRHSHGKHVKMAARRAEGESVAKYEKLVRTMQEMGDFKELANMAENATGERSAMDDWVGEWKGRAEKMLAHEPSMASDLGAEDSAQTVAQDGPPGASPQRQKSGHGAGHRRDYSRSSAIDDVLGHLTAAPAAGHAEAGHRPAAEANHAVDAQTQSLVDFNEAFQQLMTFTEETDKARREYENNTINLYKASRIARRQAQYPLAMVERYVETAKLGFKGQEELNETLTRLRHNWQVIAEAAGIESGLSGTETFKGIERDLHLENLGRLKGDLGNLPKEEISVWDGMDPDSRSQDGAQPGASHRPAASSAASSPSGSAAAASTPSPTHSPASRSRRTRAGTDSTGKEIPPPPDTRLLSWLERIVEKQRKKNDVRSTDVLEIESKCAKSGRFSALNAGVAAAATVRDYDPETASELLYFLMSAVKSLHGQGHADLVSMMGMAFQSLLAEIQWLAALLRASQGGNSPHIKVINSLVQAVQREQLMRKAAEDHVRKLGVDHETLAARMKQISGRSEDLLDRLAKKEKVLVEVKGNLGEASEEARALRERVRVLEAEVQLLEGNMTVADHRAAATGQAVHHGLKFQGTLRTANLVCKWNGLSKEVQATGNGRADDPHALVDDLPEPVEEAPEEAPPQKARRRKGATGKSAVAKSGRKSAGAKAAKT